jgi:hypothetical protein
MTMSEHRRGDQPGRTAPPNAFLGRSAPPPPKRKVRVFTWIIVGVNVLFLLATIFALSSGSGAAEQTCAGQTFDEVFTKQDCLDAANAGAAIGSGILVFGLLVVWALVDVILGVLWMVTRKRTA